MKNNMKWGKIAKYGLKVKEKAEILVHGNFKGKKRANQLKYRNSHTPELSMCHVSFSLLSIFVHLIQNYTF